MSTIYLTINQSINTIVNTINQGVCTMSRDKAATNAKIVQCMREEFLTYGYEKASLNRISANVGITTAALYKHFKNKEDMFYYLVKDTLNDFCRQTDSSQSQMETDPDYNPFDYNWALFWVDFIFDHYEGFKLLICCSKGSAYESFEENAIQKETEANKEYAEMLRRSGKMTKRISDMQWHVLSTTYVHLIAEIVRHDMTREEALDHMQFVSQLIFPGWKELFGLNN